MSVVYHMENPSPPRPDRRAVCIFQMRWIKILVRMRRLFAGHFYRFQRAVLSVELPESVAFTGVVPA